MTPEAPSPTRISTPSGKRAESASVGATRIIQAALRPDVEVAELAEFAHADPAFALRVLAFVNSSIMGLPQKIGDVRQACTLLGIRGLRTLALSLVVTNLTPAASQLRHLLGNCLRRAVVARNLARHMSFADADTLFTAGLFLDLGLLLLAADNPVLAGEIGQSPAVWRVTRERAMGLLPHPERGARTAEEYGLAKTLVEALLYHHAPTPPTEPSAAIAWLAERGAAVFEGGDPEYLERQLIEAAAAIGFPTSQLKTALAEVPGQVSELARVFDRDVGPQPDIDTLRGQAQAELAILNAQYESLIRSLEIIIAKKEALETELRSANARLERLASVDELTGLLNRRAIEEALHHKLAQSDREHAQFSLLMLDIDHFKAVNDTWGHQVGDLVLAMVGETLLRNLRTNDIGGRYGGEEFLCLLPETNAQEAYRIAERLRNTILERAVPGPRGVIQITISVGTATTLGPGCKTAGESLLREADERLYRAKGEGRNRVVSQFTPTTASRVTGVTAP